MATKCANNWCLTPRHDHGGKLFRLDIDLGSVHGNDERKTEYIWLCASCVLLMHPNVVVTGNTVRVTFIRNEPMRLAETEAPLSRAN
jgi:hypothetical protein